MDLRKILNKHIYLISILCLSLLISWPLFLPGYFSHHDDLQVMRIFEMRKCLDDLQIPCRWVPDLGFGFGYPLFNYYNVFPYYIGAIASYFLGFLGSAKLLFFIPLVLAGISMYLLARELFDKLTAILVATLFSLAPYRALDIYVRGAVAESFSIAIFPLLFYFALKLTKENLAKYRMGLVLSFAVFLTSHNIMVLLLAPVILVVFVIWYWGKKFSQVKTLIYSLLLGFGLSAFFIIPAFFEKNLVQIDNLVRFDLNFRAHFVNLYQLFLDRSWGYDNKISFQIGWPHYFLVLASIFTIFIGKRWNLKLFPLNIVLLITFILSVFMTHVRSVFIWEQIDILKFTQFPWRFLALTIFSASLLGGFMVFQLGNLLKLVVVLSLIAVTLSLNFGYFKPEKFYYLTDREKLSGKLWVTQQRAAILDYLPVGAVEPREAAGSPTVVGESEIESFTSRSNKWKFRIKAKTASEVTVPVFDFPNWKVFEGKNLIHHTKDNIGRIKFTLQPGDYLIEGKFTNTPIRTFSNIVTLISLLILILGYGKIRKIFN